MVLFHWATYVFVEVLSYVMLQSLLCVPVHHGFASTNGKFSDKLGERKYPHLKREYLTYIPKIPSYNSSGVKKDFVVCPWTGTKSRQKMLRKITSFPFDQNITCNQSDCPQFVTAVEADTHLNRKLRC